jgi:hypothetical protein
VGTVPRKTGAREAEAHLLEIARCPVVAACLSDPALVRPCAKLVRSQWKHHTTEERLAAWPRFHQLPEPWVGHLAEAPILFIGSNPGLGSQIPPNPREAPRKPHFVTIDWPGEQIIDAFENGLPSSGAPYWNWIRGRAAELMIGRAAVAGIDYALTEVARCRSNSERDGVGDAAEFCSRTYLPMTLRLSGAAVVVTVGALARKTVRSLLSLDAEGDVQEARLGVRSMLVTALAHPAGSRSPKSFKRFAATDVERLRATVAGAAG